MKHLSHLNRPWIHFLCLGFLLFALRSGLFPEPKPIIGPLNTSRLKALSAEWLANTGRVLSGEERSRLIEEELDRDILFHRASELDLHLHDQVIRQRLIRNMKFLDMAKGKAENDLFREALDLRLHLGDEVVRRRMVQLMRDVLLIGNPPLKPTEQEILAEFKAREGELKYPARYSIDHIFFSPDREANAETVMKTIRSQNLDGEVARKFSAAFLAGYRFENQTGGQLARQFGTGFVQDLEASDLQQGAWTGPLKSPYGLHYVWIVGVEPERDVSLEEVRPQLLYEITNRAKSRARENAMERLRVRYEVRR